MARRSLSLKERRAIRDRLERFREKHYPNQEAMNRDVGVPHNTASGWFGGDPRTPDPVSLVRLAERKNVNLNWVLLGEGPELRGVEGDKDVWSQLRQTLIAELVSHGAPLADAKQMVPPEDWLFHYLIQELLEGWTRWERRKRRLPERTIGAALERLALGIDPQPKRRIRRRLI